MFCTINDSFVIFQVTDRARQDLQSALSVLNSSLLHSTYLAGERVTLADVAVAATLLLPFQHVVDAAARKEYR